MAMVAAVAEIYARYPRPVPPKFPYGCDKTMEDHGCGLSFIVSHKFPA